MAVFDLALSDEWKKEHPRAAMGVLVVDGIINTTESMALEIEKGALTKWLRERFDSREAIKADATLGVYAAYYKRFKKNYHVFFQLESVAVKGKPIARVNALVEAMFMAELKHGLLTAGHDLDAIAGEVTLDSARGDERYETMGGEEKTLKAGDMFVRDELAVLSSIIYGPDHRTRITEGTRRALFTIYAPEGISAGAVMAQMEDIFRWIRMFCAEAQTAKVTVYAADQGKQ
jgi:DNA/RNA-binding domain of Phe-tRNA-synthetase-like protein